MKLDTLEAGYIKKGHRLAKILFIKEEMICPIIFDQQTVDNLKNFISTIFEQIWTSLYMGQA